MTCAILPKLEDPIRFHENLINAFLLRDAYKTWKNFSPLKLEDLSKQGTVSLGYPNIKEEQKRVVTIFFLVGKMATAHAEDVRAHHILWFRHYIIVQALTIPRAMDTSRVY